MQSISNFACTLSLITANYQLQQTFPFLFPANKNRATNGSRTILQEVNISSGFVFVFAQEMEYLIRQTNRVRFSGQQSIGGPGSSSSRDRRIPPQKTPSIKEDKKRPQNWFRRQITWQMNQDLDLNEIERATAIAAAAYAISSLEESSIPGQKKVSKGTETSLPGTKSRKKGEDSMRIPEIQDEKTPAKVVRPTPSMKKTPTFPEKPALPMKKIPTFAEDQLSRTDEIQPQSPKPKPDMPAKKPETAVPKPDQAATTKPAASPAKFDRQTSTRPVIGGAKADTWESAELAKIKKKYEEMEARILSWESKRKAKSRRRLDRTESEVEKKRLKALEKFRSEVVDINEIAEGARSKAMENRRNEELKAKEKANKIRVTGKVPTECFCF